MARELYGIQMLRGFAAVAVVVHHTLEESNGSATAFSPDWITTFGASGVDIFFVISGFIMLYTCFPAGKPPLSSGKFLFRRATRIYPLYWICCAAMLAIMLLGFLKSHHVNGDDILFSLFLLPSSNLIIGVSWTLVFEMYFYLVFAITLLFGNALVSVVGTTATIAAMLLAAEVLGGSGTLGAFLTNPIVFEFVLGLWIGLGFTHAVARWPVSKAWAAFGVLFLAVASLYVFHANTNGLTGWSRLLTWGVPAAIIVAAFLSVSAPRNATGRLMVFLGDASYALYLTHVFVMLGYAVLLKKTALGSLPQIAIVPLIVLIATAVGIAAHLVVEAPLIRAIRRWSGRSLGGRPVLMDSRLSG